MLSLLSLLTFSLLFAATLPGICQDVPFRDFLGGCFQKAIPLAQCILTNKLRQTTRDHANLSCQAQVIRGLYSSLELLFVAFMYNEENLTSPAGNAALKFTILSIFCPVRASFNLKDADFLFYKDLILRSWNFLFLEDHLRILSSSVFRGLS